MDESSSGDWNVGVRLKKGKIWMDTHVSNGLLSALNLHERLAFRTTDDLERPERSQHRSRRNLRVVKIDSPVSHVFLYSGVGDLPPNQPFESENGILGINNRLTLSGKPSQALPVFREAYD